MKRIDASKWKEFCIGELFEKLQLGIKNEKFNKTLDVSEIKTSEFNLPLVNAKHGNNGIMYYGREEDFETAEMTIDIVQNGAIATGDVYAQPQKTGVLWDAYLIKSKKSISSSYTLMFIATVLEKAIKDKFSYDNKCVWDKLSQLFVRLPVTMYGEPDVGFMDSYMKKIMKESKIRIDCLRQTDKPKLSVDFKYWKEFQVSNLFDIHPTKAYKLTNNQLLDDNGRNPVVVNSGFNNGIGGYSNYDCTEQAGIITFTDTAAKSTDSFFYQEHDFVGYPHVQGMYPKDHRLTKNEGLFIATILRASVGKYDFISKMTREDILSLTIKLPASRDKTPDWDYMDSYMQKITKESETKLQSLANIQLFGDLVGQEAK